MAFPAPRLPGQLKSPGGVAPMISPRTNLLHVPKYTLKTNNRRRKARVTFVRASSDEASSQAIFGGEKQLSASEKLLEGLSAPARYGACVAIVAGALAAGYVVGSSRVGTRNAALGGALALGVAGGVTAYALNSTASRIAAVNVHNKVVNCGHPSSLTKEDIDSVLNKYGVSKQDEAFNTELRDLYDRFVSSVIPPGNEDLKGDEADTIMKFKNTLGIDDPDAAAVHLEIGRRIFRQRLETGDNDAVIEERRAFQKLVYVSSIIFGDASKFLLPWKRVFNITDAQIEVAIRDNAQRLFKSRLSLLGRDLHERQLMKVREEQLKLKLSDEVASDMVKDYTRSQIEENILSALEILKSRRQVRESTTVMEELDKICAYNRALTALTQHADKKIFPPGIGPVSLIGGAYDSGRKFEDLKQLYRAYITEAFSGGRIEDEQVAALNDLKIIFGLDNIEAEQTVLEITTKVYRRRLSKAVSGGDLETAPSKATFLQCLCDELHLDPQKASKVHEDIYRQKLQQCLMDGDLNEEDATALLRLRVLLCIPQQTVDAAHEEMCGHLFQKVVREAVSGVHGYDDDIKAAVKKAYRGLRLSKETAIAISSKPVRAMFRDFVKEAKAAENQFETAVGLKKLIVFNRTVVTELVADIKGESPDVSPKPSKEEPKKEEEDEWEQIGIPREGLEDKLGIKKAQTEITLKEDLSLKDRSDLYQAYLLFCAASGRQMGDRDYLDLAQLGGILGLTPKEISDVHTSFAEQGFRKKAVVIVGDGQLSEERIERLNELQKKVGLPSESAQKIIKSIVTAKIGGAIEAAMSRGTITIEQIRKLRGANVELDKRISKGARENIFRKIIDEIFSSGTGDFSEEEIYERIPADLGMDANKAKKMIQDRAKERLSSSLVQAAALLRQRNLPGVVSSLNNLLGCDKAVHGEPLSWSVQEEVADLFCIYLKGNPPEEKVARLQYLLGIDESTASLLKESVKKGKFTLGVEEEEFVF